MAAGRAEERADVRVQDRVRLWMAAEGRRDDLVAYEAARFQEEGFPTRVERGRVYAELPVVDAPPEVLELAPDETRLQVRLLHHGIRAAPAGASGFLVSLTLAAWVPGVDSSAATAEVSLRHDRGRTTVEPVLVDDVELRRLSGARHVDHAHGRLEVSALVPAVPDRVEVAFCAAGVDRATTVPLQPPPPAPAGAVVEVARVELSGDVLGLQGHQSGEAVPAGWRLRGPVTATAEPGDGRVVLRHDPWGDGDRVLPSGTYALEAVVGGVSVPAVPSPPLADALPLTVRSEAFRGRVRLGAAGLEVTLGPPHLDDEVGPVAQQRLQRWYAERGPAARRTRGLPAGLHRPGRHRQPGGDPPGARRQRAPTCALWGVADRSVRGPGGRRAGPDAQPRVVRRAGASAYVVTNIDLERWFRKRPGQRVLQTFHGYPSKTMGSRPGRRRTSPRRASSACSGAPPDTGTCCSRRRRRWTGTTASSTATTAHPARGYPRDDVLVSARRRGPPRRRAPAGWASATEAWRALRAHLARRPGHELPGRADGQPLRRGRGRGACWGTTTCCCCGGTGSTAADPAAAGSRVVDVTDYPEINDLILAADVAVLDYSSLRFDFALTGRPMVFLVPDLERYEGARGFLHDFRASAPGPLLTTTEEVVAALGDVPGLAAAYAGGLADFNNRFNGHQDGHAAERVVEAFFRS